MQSTYGQVTRAFQTQSHAPTLAAYAENVGRIQEELRRAAERLEKIEPPENVEEPNEELAEAFRAYADDLDRLRQAAERDDSEAIRAYNASEQRKEVLERIGEAAEEMRGRGYDTGSLEPD